MNYTFAENKNPALAWDQVRANSLGKRSGSLVHAQASRLDKFNLRKLLGALAENLMEALIVTALCYGLFQGYLFLTKSPRFQISGVIIVGNRVLGRDQLLRWIGPVRGKNIFTLNPRDLATRLGEHPWIRGVSVERKFPNSIRIHLEERTPYARIQFDKIYLMDNYGVLMAEDILEYRDLPLIKGMVGRNAVIGQKLPTQELLPSLQIMYYLNRLPFFQADPLDTAEITDHRRVAFVTRERKAKILMDMQTATEGFENFKIVLDLIRPEQKRYEYIDLSARNKIFVKAADSGDNRAKQAMGQNTGGD